MKDSANFIAAIVAFLITSILGFFVIPYLKRLKFGQTILEDGPTWHKSKQGTPTMGGVMIVTGFIVSLAIALCVSFSSGGRFSSELRDPLRLTYFVAGIGLALCMSAIGFMDDYIKVVKKRNLGLTAKQKTLLQLIVSAIYLLALRLGGMTVTTIPFIGDISVISGFGLLFWPVALMFIYGFVNAVNLTDGVDGLASSVTLIVCCTFMMVSGSLYNMTNNVFAAAAAGACVGFIFWNAKPARVFMGDTGSMFLGGVVVALAFGTGRPIILIPAGCIYLFEALSDIIQVAYYKKTKKRIFKMAPLHHHFEMCGWSEEKVVFVFSIVTFIGCLIAALPVILKA